MSAASELDAELAQVIALLTQAQDMVVTAQTCWDERETALGVLHGSADPEAIQLLAEHQQVADNIGTEYQRARQTRVHVEHYRAYVGVSDSGSPPGGSPSTTVRSRYPTARDGSEYPDAAAPVADILPPRVRERGERGKTVGYVDGSPTIKFVSGKDQTWTPEIEKRARAVGIGARLADKLRSHVEMKVATMMLQRGRQHAELVINHVPCGSQAYQGLGCDQALERYLPSGYTLTVHGTTQNGTPLTRRYRGTA